MEKDTTVETEVPQKTSEVDQEIERSMALARSMADGIRSRYDEIMLEKQRVSPQVHLRASSFGHPCDRKLVHDILDWEKKAPFPVQAYRNFERGDVTEAFAVQLLGKLGYRLIGEQTDYYDKALNLSGRIEGFIVADDRQTKILAEIKSGAGDWLRPLLSLRDDRLCEHDYLLSMIREHEFGRSYYTQTQIYLFLKGLAAALLIVWDVPRWRPIPIPIPLDWEFAHNMVERAKKINRAISLKRLPDYIREEKVCTRCPHYGRACNPPIVTDAVDVILDPDIIAKLERHEIIKPIGLEYKDLDEELKDEFKAPDKKPIIAAGPFIVKVKEHLTTTYDVPKDIKQQFAKKSTQRRVTWERLTPKPERETQ